jgi:hypothetical protein
MINDKTRPFLKNLDRSEQLLKFHDDHLEKILLAKGSSHNHQVWVGGYQDHLVHCFVLAETLYRFFENHSVPLEFSLESAIIVIYFHDIEKIYREDEGFFKPNFYNDVLINKYGIIFDDQEKNALKYAHGEGEDYSKHRRVATPLAGFLHSIDNLSARVLYNVKDI